MTAPAHHRSLKHSLQQALMALLVVAWPLSIVACAGVAVFAPNTAEAKVDRVKLDLRALDSAMKAYVEKTGVMPETGEGMSALVSAQILAHHAVDPWDHDYVYVKEGSQPVFISYGKDGAPGGSEDDADLSSKDLE